LPGAEVEKGLSIKGRSVNKADKDILNWLKIVGCYKIKKIIDNHVRQL